MVTIVSERRKLIPQDGVGSASPVVLSTIVEGGDGFIVVGDEIRFGEPDYMIYKIPVGVGWSDGRKSTGVTFDRVILEYKSYIGVAPTSSVSRNPAIYGFSHVTVGLPKDRYSWLKNELIDIGFSLQANDSEAPTDTHVFVSIGIKPDHRVLGDPHGNSNVFSVLMSARSSLSGVADIEISLARLGYTGSNGLTRRLMMSLKSFTVVEMAKESTCTMMVAGKNLTQFFRF